jgi:arylsulfatase A-like enzyme
MIRYACIQLLCLLTAAASYAQQRPNIILVLADDLGWKDLGCTGAEYYETPNIDAFAKTGMRFTQAYAGASNCAPSRACLISGMYGPRTGIYTVGRSDRGRAADRRLIPVTNRTKLDTGLLTLPRILQQNGYVTAVTGKWHLGPNPLQQGFDVNIAGGMNGHPSSYFSPYRLPSLSEGPEGEYLTDRLTTEAIRFMAAQKQQPFFLYLPHYAVHTPLQAPEGLVQQYRHKKPVNGQGNAVYAAMIESMDRNFGRLLKAVDSLGLGENTIIIFSSDNGGIRHVSSQSPLRAGKGSYYEGGIRVPLLVYWKGRVPAGAVCNSPVINLDLYPTLLDITGIRAPESLDGISIKKLWRTPEAGLPQRSLFWHFPIYLESYAGAADQSRDTLFRTRPGSAMRQGKWKLIEYFEDKALELFDLKKDPGETHNLAATNTQQARKMQDMLQRWRAQTHAGLPTPKSDR